MQNLAYRLHRQRNNEAARKSREAAKSKRAKRSWVLNHPDLDDAQRQDAERFLLGGKTAPPDAETRAILRLHLISARATSRDRYRRLLGLLDAAGSEPTT